MSDTNSEAAPAGLELRLSRHLPATPEEAFDAYTDAEKQMVWFSLLDDAPAVVEITVDLRVGGTQTALWGPDRARLFRETQTFLEIDRPHRLVTRSVGATPAGETMTTYVTVTFEPDGDGTLMSVHHAGFPVPQVRDFFVADAWPSAFDRLAMFLDRGDRP